MDYPNELAAALLGHLQQKFPTFVYYLDRLTTPLAMLSFFHPMLTSHDKYDPGGSIEFYDDHVEFWASGNSEAGQPASLRKCCGNFQYEALNYPHSIAWFEEFVQVGRRRRDLTTSFLAATVDQTTRNT